MGSVLTLLGGALWVLLVLPSPSRLGFLLGLGLIALIRRSAYRESPYLFLGLPGLYLFLNTNFQRTSLLIAFNHYLALLTALFLYGFFLRGLEARRHRVPLWLAPLLLLRPEGWSLAGIALLLSVWAWERTSLLAQGSWRPQPSALLWTFFFTVLLCGGLLFLHPPHLNPQLPNSASHHLATSTPPIQGTSTGGQVPQFFSPSASLPQSLEELLSFALLALLIIALFAIRSGKASRLLRGPLLPLVLGALYVILLFLYAAVHEGGRSTSRSTLGQQAILHRTAASLPLHPLTSTPPLIEWGGAVMVGIAFLVALAGIAGLLRLLGRTETAATQEARQRPSTRSMSQEAPEDPIRRAYWRVLRATEHRLPRGPAESAREYADRLARRFPELGRWIWELTQLYEPARYGGPRSPEAQERAQTLADQLIQEIR